MESHDAILILKNAISAPKLIYTLSCSPCSSHTGLDEFDRIQRSALSQITNLQIDDLGWMQASLPVAAGGLGIRSVAQLAPSAFLASAAATSDLQTALLPQEGTFTDYSRDMALAIWTNRHTEKTPELRVQSKQKAWDRASVEKTQQALIDGYPDPYHQARLLATRAAHSGDWLNAWPITACGLRLSNEAIRVAVGLRIGSPLCAPHLCPCGAAVDARGSHGLSCRRSAGRQSRHAQLNDVIHRSLIKAGVPASKEPVGLLRSGDKRPDGYTLVGWEMGKCLVWDSTVPDTVAQSHLPDTSIEAGAAARRAANIKNDKYAELDRNYLFCAVAIETLGPINAEGERFISELGRRLSLSSGDKRETMFLFQRLSIIVQRGNAVSFSGSFDNFWPTR